MAKQQKSKSKKQAPKPTRNYKNGRGPECSNCHEVGHYRRTCGK